MKTMHLLGTCLLVSLSLLAEEKEMTSEEIATSEKGTSMDSVDGQTSASPKTTKTEKKGFTVFYAIEGKNLLAQVSYKTSGWIAIGFKPTKKMKDANIIIGYVADGKSVVEDHFGTKIVSHENDAEIGGKKSINKSNCWEKEGTTSLWISIPLDSKDKKDVVLKKGEKMEVIVAAGKNDNVKTKHSKRTHFEIEL